ncbi:hypothetical protein Tco_1010115 [Tanacetum coccineum]
MAMSNNIQAKIANVNNVMKPSGPVTSIVDLDTNSKNKMIEVKVYRYGVYAWRMADFRVEVRRTRWEVHRTKYFVRRTYGVNAEFD